MVDICFRTRRSRQVVFSVEVYRRYAYVQFKSRIWWLWRWRS